MPWQRHEKLSYNQHVDVTSASMKKSIDATDASKPTTNTCVQANVGNDSLCNLICQGKLLQTFPDYSQAIITSKHVFTRLAPKKASVLYAVTTGQTKGIFICAKIVHTREGVQNLEKHQHQASIYWIGQHCA
jgi:hypothetical protein